MNETHMRMTLYSDQADRIVYQKDTLSLKNGKTQIAPKRSDQALRLIALQDSIRTVHVIYPRNSASYYLNILQNAGIGMLIDRNNPKRYAYPMHIHLGEKDSVYRRSFHMLPEKGKLYMHASIPYINVFYLHPAGEPAKADGGFMGLAIGLDYYYDSAHFVSLLGVGIMDFALPFPAPIDYFDGEYEFVRSAWLGLTHNHHIYKLKLGYGLSYAENIWTYQQHTYDDSLGRDFSSRTLRSHALGLALPAYVQFGRAFHVGLIYRPSFLRLDILPRWKYEHVISLDFAWKIGLPV